MNRWASWRLGLTLRQPAQQATAVQLCPFEALLLSTVELPEPVLGGVARGTLLLQVALKLAVQTWQAQRRRPPGCDHSLGPVTWNEAAQSLPVRQMVEVTLHGAQPPDDLGAVTPLRLLYQRGEPLAVQPLA